MAVGSDLEALLDAAADEISHYGLRRTSIHDIARRARVSRPTAYRRLGNKDALLQLLLARIASAFWSDCQFAGGGERTPVPERAGELFAAGMRTARAHPVVSQLLNEDPDLVIRVWTTSDNAQLLNVRQQIARSLDPGHTLANKQSARAADLLQRLGVSFLSVQSDLFDDGAIQKIVTAAVEAAIGITD